ncbi:AMP-binding protein, partial [Acinetobacter baumannii]
MTAITLAQQPTTAERTAHLFTFDGFISFWAEDRPDRMALDGPDARLTYGELEATTAAIVAALADLGVHKGDRVAWFGKNCTLYFAL